MLVDEELTFEFELVSFCEDMLPVPESNLELVPVDDDTPVSKLSEDSIPLLLYAELNELDDDNVPVSKLSEDSLPLLLSAELEEIVDPVLILLPLNMLLSDSEIELWVEDVCEDD